MANKIAGLAQAAALVPDGASISFGGFTTQRHPMAFIHELIRLKRRDLYLFGHSPGGDWDILIGAGCVKHVCHAPFGAHPYAVFNYYDYDPRQLKLYHAEAEDDLAFRQYLERFVYGVKDHTAYLEAVGGAARLESLRADPGYGYRPDLKRRRLD